MAIQRTIFENLYTILSTITWVVKVNYDKIRLSAADFMDHEIPLIQFYPNTFIHTHVKGRLQTEMQLSVEVVLRKTTGNSVNVLDLLDKMQDVEQKIGENLQLNIQSSMIGVKYLSSFIDLHLVDPFYIGTLIFSVEYYKPYTGVC